MKRIIFLLLISVCTFISNAKNIIFNVTVPYTGFEAFYTSECWIAGNFNNWNNTDKKMIKVDDTHYSIIMDDATWFPNVTIENVEYKYLKGCCDWGKVEKDITGLEVLPHKYSDNNGNDTVVRWAYWPTPPLLHPMNVTVDVTVPKGTIQCYIVGNFNNWAGPTAPADSCKMNLIATNTDGTMIFEKTVFTADATILAYHFCSGPDWAYEQATPTNDFHYPEVQPIVLSWNAIYDPTKLGNVNIEATVPSTGTGDHVYIQGSFNGWSWNNPLEMTKNNDGTYSYLINNIASTEYKIYNGTDWGYVEVDATGTEVANRSVTATPQQTITQNITVIGWKTIMALKQLNADNYKVYTNGHSIVVEGVTSQVEVYDASGRTMQSVKTMGTFTSRNLNAGLYILKVDGATRKVALN
jgi:hypothetical protein